MTLPQTPAMILLRPGDRVMILLNEDPGEDEALGYSEALHESFPGVEFVIVGGVTGVAMLPAEPKPKKVARRPKL
jgi:hypothetical protein